MPILAGYDPNPSRNLRCEIAFTTGPDDPNPAWVDMTSRLDVAAGVSITRGRNDEFSTIQPSSCNLTLNNYDGALTAGRTGSAFYPNVRPYRKVRVSYRNPATAGNLLTASQASMESGVTDWASNTAFGSLDAAAVSSSTVHPWIGTQGGLATWPTTALGSMAWTLATGLVIGRTYTASAWVWVPSGSPDVKMQVLFGTGGTATSTKNTFVRISVTFTATLNVHFIGPLVSSATSGQLCYFDAVMIDEGSTVADFTFDAPQIDYRFTGNVEEFPVEWAGLYAQAAITATDRLARIGARRAMRSVIEEAVLANSPFAYYPMGEPEGATMAGDTSGTPGVTPLSTVQVGSGGTLTFGTATGPPTDALPAPTFTPSSVANGKYLTGVIPNHGLDGVLGFYNSITLRASFLTSTAAAQTIVRVDDTYGAYLDLGISAAGKVTATQLGAFSGGVPDFTITSASSFTDGNTHDAELVLSISGATITATLYVDSVSVGTASFSSGFLPAYTRILIGGTPSGLCLTGVICHVAAFITALTAAQILEHYTATSTGFAGERSDQRIQRYARWAGIDDTEMALDVGSSTSIAFTDTTGQSFLQAMQDVASTENGRLFINGAGQLVFHSRARGYANAAAVASLDANLLGSGSTFSMSTQGLVNDATAQRPDGPTIRAFDQPSIDEYGVFSQSLTTLVTTDAEVTDAAYWRVLTNSTPQVRIPSAEFDAYTDASGYQAQLRALEIGDRLTITGLPSQAVASTVDLTVEGYSESIGVSGWTITANTSNYATGQALVLDDAVFGLLDGDNRLIY